MDVASEPYADTSVGQGVTESESNSAATVEQLIAQNQSLKAQLRAAQKLASIGTTAAMLAHEYNNILTPVVSYAQYALDREDVSLMQKTLKMILKQHSAVQSMSDRLLGLARQDSGSHERVELKTLVLDAVSCLGRDLSKDNIELQIEVDPNLCVLGNQNQLLQVLFNMIINARQAVLGRKGLIRITATPISCDRVTLHIRDTGKGISKEHLDRVFDPFFTTKHNERSHEKRGIGLGLAICKDIIEEHNGRLDVESVQDSGTTFSISLPLAH